MSPKKKRKKPKKPGTGLADSMQASEGDNTSKADPETINNLYGLIFVAACDFSKKAYDEFRQWCRNHKLLEFYPGGWSSLEDLLFRPNYDHLLFAYFGIFLQIRKRSAKTKLRGLLSIKRQAIKHLHRGQPVLLRDPDATDYPYKGGIKDFDKYPKWRVYRFLGHCHSGLKFEVKSAGTLLPALH